MKRMVLLLACFAIMTSGVQAGELFRWVDKDGKVHYGDTRPADVTGVERKKLSSGSEQNEDLSYETRRAKQNFPVTLYVTKDCGQVCEQARRTLSKRGIPFSEKMLQTKQDAEDFRHLSGIDGVVPVLGVGKNFLKGYLEPLWNNELDIAGYPKTAPYRAPSAPASSQVIQTKPSVQ